MDYLAKPRFPCWHAISSARATASENAAVDLSSVPAQLCGSRIRHEDEKNASAILMRILQIRRLRHRHPPCSLRTFSRRRRRAERPSGPCLGAVTSDRQIVEHGRRKQSPFLGRRSPAANGATIGCHMRSGGVEQPLDHCDLAWTAWRVEQHIRCGQACRATR
jgi:hypothetical protein